MELLSTHLATAPGGVVLTTAIEGETIQSYVVVAPPDINAVADIVPASEFERGADVHATAVIEPGEALDKIEEVLENVQPGDVVVFLCASDAVYAETLTGLGYAAGAMT